MTTGNTPGSHQEMSVTCDALSNEQAGHIRHIDNLSRQLPNDWSFMQSKAFGQEDFGGYRFQLSYMAYALALAHVHRLPNAPGVFKPIFERLIGKLLLPEVWTYWRDVSRGGAVFNAHLTASLKEEWDPVGRDNIMYSAYVQSVTALYHHLFDDDQYQQPGALSFEFWSFFWGGEPKSFPYDERTLNEHLYWQMVESGFIGIACEPNCAFQICNQPAILGFRMNDLVNGGRMADEVTTSYEKVWTDLGRLDSTGHYNMMRLQDSGTVLPNAASAPWIDAWCGTLMNMWNREFVRANYPRQIKDFVLDLADGLKTIVDVPPGQIMGQTVENDTCDFGWVATWASEMGDHELLEGLLAYADRYMNPTWLNGGLFYPRNDTKRDEAGNLIGMEPLTGNALLAYARLNVPDGLWKLYNHPWGVEHHNEPNLTAVGDDISVSQARFDAERNTLTFRVQRHAERHGDGAITINNIVNGRCHLAVDGRDISDTSNADTSCVDVDPRGSVLRITVPAGEPHTYSLRVGSEVK
ncbi:MAG: hypothetical protein AB1925_09735 [Actinomycetota bacterium]